MSGTIDNSNRQYALFASHRDDHSVNNYYGMDKKDLERFCQSVVGQIMERVKDVVADQQKLTSIVESNVIERIYNEGQALTKETIEKNFGLLKKEVNKFCDDVMKQIKDNADRIEMYCSSMAHYAGEIYLIFCKSSLDRANFNKSTELAIAYQCLRDADFTGAIDLFNKATNDGELKAEAYFGLALAKYNIQLIWDCKKGKEVPICYDNGNGKNLEDSSDFKMAIAEGTNEEKIRFNGLVEEIKKIREQFKVFENQNLEYDGFVCMKVTELNTNERTDDCQWFDKNYKILSDILKDKKLFYSEKDCQKYDAGSFEYAALISYALSRAKCMLLVCSNESYLDTPWVKNEYTRFRRALKAKNLDDGQIIIVFKDEEVNLPNRGEYQDFKRGDITDANKQEWLENLAQRIRTQIDVGNSYVLRNFKYCPMCNKKFGSDQDHCPKCKINGTYIVPLLDAHEYLNRKNKALQGEVVEAQKETDEYKEELDNLKKAYQLLKEEKQIINEQLKKSEEIQKNLDNELSELKKSCNQSNVFNIEEFYIVDNVLIKYKGEEKDVVIPDVVTSIGEYAFSGCNSLKSIEIPSSVTSIGNSAFYNCINLNSIEIPDSVTSIGNSAFYNCRNLYSIDIPESITKIGDSTFYNCKDLTYIEIPSSVTSIGYAAFARCYSLKGIEIPSCVTSIGSNAFYHCEDFESIYIPKSVTSMGEEVFAGCRGVAIYCEVESKPSDWDGSWDCDYNEDLDAPTVSSVVWNCQEYGITKDRISWALTKDGEIIIVSYLSYYGDVTEVVLPSTVDGHSVTRIEDKAFYYSEGVTSIKIPNGVTSIGDETFFGCKSLESINIPSSVTSIGDNAFSWCERLAIYCEAESQPRDWKDDWHSYRPVIWNCQEYGISENGIKWGLTKEGEITIAGCTGTPTEVVIPDTINGHSVTSIGTYAFNGSDLGVDENCNRWIRKITIPSSVTSVGAYAFRGCVNLPSVVIPSKVKSIGEWAFYPHKRDLIIYCETSSKPNEWDSKWNSNRPVVWGYKAN